MPRSSWWMGPRGEGYVVIQFILFALIGFGPRRLGSMVVWHSPWSTWGVVVGIILGSLGGLLALLGTLRLGSNLTPFPRPKENSGLVDSGVYSVVRHPIYSGIMVVAVGWACFVNGTFTFIYAFILFLFFDVKSRREEQWLCAAHSQYPAYQKRVRKLIPFIY